MGAFSLSNALLGVILCIVSIEAVNSDNVETCAKADSLLQSKQHRGRQLSTASDLPMPATSPPIVANIPDKLLKQMVLPAPYPCHALGVGDPRFTWCGHPSGCVSMCGRTELVDGLHPMAMSPGPWKDSLRIRAGPIGSLPCCQTGRYCTAPACKSPGPSALALGTEPATCTKYPAESNYAYLTHTNVWPAFYGWGGSYELDVNKHWDLLHHMFGCYDNSTGQCRHSEPFDIAIDLGADHGTLDERWSEKKFAKDFILVDAAPGSKPSFDTFFGDAKFTEMWYREQVPDWPADREKPLFEFFTNGISNTSHETLDMCDNGTLHACKMVGRCAPCLVEVLTVDDIVPPKLSPKLQSRFAEAQSAYVKIDLEGYDQLAIDGMRKLLSEVRGTYDNGAPRHLVNFMMLEHCPSCMKEEKGLKGFADYNLGTNVRLLESLGFEVFMIGPRYIPISHGSWTESFTTFTNGPESKPDSGRYPEFQKLLCPNGHCPDAYAQDLFAMRASHPQATNIKLALGACAESHEFDLSDEQYVQ